MEGPRLLTWQEVNSSLAVISGHRVRTLFSVCNYYSHLTQHTHTHLYRQYFHIWSSRSPQTHLLLPPSPGVDWHGGHRRPPLFDPDPQQQSAYYRKWSKPAEKEVKVALDGLTKESSKGSRRRYLLTGPSQVCGCELVCMC